MKVVEVEVPLVIRVPIDPPENDMDKARIRARELVVNYLNAGRFVPTLGSDYRSLPVGRIEFARELWQTYTDKPEEKISGSKFAWEIFVEILKSIAAAIFWCIVTLGPFGILGLLAMYGAIPRSSNSIWLILIPIVWLFAVVWFCGNRESKWERDAAVQKKKRIDMIIDGSENVSPNASEE